MAQGPPRKHATTQPILFQNINWVFCPNGSAEMVRKEPNNLKRCGGGIPPVLWKNVSRMDHKHPPDIHLPSMILPGKSDVCPVPLPHQESEHTSVKCWRHLLGVLGNIIPSISGGGGIILHLQSTLSWKVHTHLNPVIHAKLIYWHHLVPFLQLSPTHMLEAILPKPICFWGLRLLHQPLRSKFTGD